MNSRSVPKLEEWKYELNDLMNLMRAEVQNKVKYCKSTDHERGKYLTSFLGHTSEGSFHSSAVGVVTPTHTTLILHLIGSNFPVTANFLKEREREKDMRDTKKIGKMCHQKHFQAFIFG